MSDANTIRVLELDGGGERGYLSLKFLEKFIQQWGVDPAKIWQEFDVICGTSIGGIMALGLATGLTTTEISPFFTDQGPLIFSTNGTPSNTATTTNKLLSLTVTGVPFYSTAGTADTYGSNLLVSTIQDTFGTKNMQNLLTNVIIPTYKVDIVGGNINTGTYTLCSNVSYPDFVGQDELISNIALATSAAPFYLPSLLISSGSPNNPGFLNGRYIDGGVYQNNPSAFGFTLGQILKPNATRCCVLSLGTGLGEMGFDDPTASLRTSLSADADPIISIRNLFSLFDVAGTGGQESVAKNLFLESTYTLNQFYYYRFQPILDPTLDTELDNTTPAILDYYNTTATNWFNNDIENISTFIGHLTA